MSWLRRLFTRKKKAAPAPPPSMGRVRHRFTPTRDDDARVVRPSDWNESPYYTTGLTIPSYTPAPSPPSFEAGGGSFGGGGASESWDSGSSDSGSSSDGGSGGGE